MDCNGYLVKIGVDTYIAVDAPEGFVAWILERNPKTTITDLLLTHQHFDHIQDAASLKERFGCKIHAAMPWSDELTLEKLVENEWGMSLNLKRFEVDEVLKEDVKTAKWGGLLWHIHHVPGHSPDGIVYQLPDEGVIFSGDSIFAGSIGRTDLPGGDLHQLLMGLESKVLNQPSDSLIFPGHGSYTTVSNENQSNPYL